MKLVISKDVEAQLDEIYDYLAERSPKAAVKFYNTMLDEMERLVIAYTATPAERYLEDRPEGFRSVVVRKTHKIIYYVDNDSVNVVLIWDCRRNPSTLRKIIKTKKEN